MAASSAIAVISLLVNCGSQATSENSLAWSIGLGAIGAAPLLGSTVDLARDRHLRKKDVRDGASTTFTALTLGAAYGSAPFVLGGYVGDAPPHGLPATALALAVLVLLGGVFAIGAGAAIRAEESRKTDAYQVRLATAAAHLHAQTVAASVTASFTTLAAGSGQDSRSVVQRA